MCVCVCVCERERERERESRVMADLYNQTTMGTSGTSAVVDGDQTYRRVRCFVFFSNFSQRRSMLRAYSYSTSPRRLKNSWNSDSSDNLESILNSSEAS